MKYYGYDGITKCLFSYDGEFKYEGKVDVAPSGAFVVEEKNRPWLELSACRFLSGHRKNCVFYMSDWEQEKTNIGLQDYLCIAGSIANEPSKISEICMKNPCNTIYVCPLVEELASFGVLITNLHEEKPRRASLCVPKMIDVVDDCLEYDKELNGDGYGKMADIINRGFPVLNAMMDCPGISPFYGRILAKKSGPPFTYIVRSDSLKRLFPKEPLSLKHYVATSVPVEVNNTDTFKKESGCEEDKINIVTSSDYITGLPIFMNFYKVMSGMDFVGTTCSKQLISSKKVPMFGYNKACRIDPRSL